jgi:hypothetical protein
VIVYGTVWPRLLRESKPGRRRSLKAFGAMVPRVGVIPGWTIRNWVFFIIFILLTVLRAKEWWACPWSAAGRAW